MMEKKKSVVCGAKDALSHVKIDTAPAIACGGQIPKSQIQLVFLFFSPYLTPRIQLPIDGGGKEERLPRS